MARKILLKEKDQQEKLNQKEERQIKLLARLGFVQMMFDFYAVPVA